MHRTENKRQAIADTMAAITDIRNHFLRHAGRDNAAYYAGLCGTIRRCLAQIAEPKPSSIREDSDDELVDFDAFARDFMTADDSAIYNGVTNG